MYIRNYYWGYSSLFIAIPVCFRLGEIPIGTSVLLALLLLFLVGRCVIGEKTIFISKEYIVANGDVYKITDVESIKYESSSYIKFSIRVGDKAIERLIYITGSPKWTVNRFINDYQSIRNGSLKQM